MNIFKKGLSLLLALSGPFALSAQADKAVQNPLSAKQHYIVSISSLTATGNLQALKAEFNGGLDAGMTVNEIKEVLVHLYAYCGFPRSLQGINTLMAVLDERKKAGRTDPQGRDASPVSSGLSRYQRGRETLEKLSGQAEQTPKTGYAAFAPIVDTFLKEHLFADLFDRDVLSAMERELVTVSVLVALGPGVEPMIRSHMRLSMNTGLTADALAALLDIIETGIGRANASAGREILAGIIGKDAGVPEKETQPDIFAKGVRAPAGNFTGEVWVNMLLGGGEAFGCTIGTVSFAPGARTNWHLHPGGQILLVTAGKGLYQERGRPLRVIQKGDIVKCTPGVEHWHGGSPGNGLTHIAISANPQQGPVKWLQPVTEQEYIPGNQHQ